MNVISVVRRGTLARWSLVFVYVSLVLFAVACAAGEPALPSATSAAAQAPTTSAIPPSILTAVPTATLGNIVAAVSRTPTRVAALTTDTATPTMTPIIGAVERATPLPTSTPDQINIRGSYEWNMDVNAKSMPWHLRGKSTATFTAKSGEGNSMKGVAQVKWSESGEGHDPKCPWVAAPFDIAWSVDLNGTFERNADGSLSIFLMPTPVQGPVGGPAVGPCGTSSPFTTAAFTVLGTLVNGTFDGTQDLPVDGQGFNWLKTHIELVPNK